MPQGPFLTTYLNKLPSLRRFVARFVVRDEDVDDILQETYVRVSDKDTQGIASLSAYMYKTARNIALNELNKKSVSVTDYLEDIVGPDTLADINELKSKDSSLRIIDVTN